MPQSRRSVSGSMADGRAIEAVSLCNALGIEVTVLSLGACVQSMIAPDAQGERADIVLGFAEAGQYQCNPDYFGVTVGRYANRIAAARFELDGRTYQLTRNDGSSSLHGGALGFGSLLWSVSDVEAGDGAGVTLTHESPDGAEGYPGTVRASVTYRLEGHDLAICYRATTDRPTIVNLSNHSYFNLGGEGCGRDVLQHRLMIPADAYLPVDAALIPTGELRDVSGSPFDFRRAKPIGQDIGDQREQQLRVGHGYDHCFILGRAPVHEPRLMARLQDPASGRTLELLSNQPALQVYSGNLLDGTRSGKSGHAYRRADGIALEAQLPPDTPNRPAFGSARLNPGELYEHRLIYRLSIGP